MLWLAASTRQHVLSTTITRVRACTISLLPAFPWACPAPRYNIYPVILCVDIVLFHHTRFFASATHASRNVLPSEPKFGSRKSMRRSNWTHLGCLQLNSEKRGRERRFWLKMWRQQGGCVRHRVQRQKAAWAQMVAETGLMKRANPKLPRGFRNSEKMGGDGKWWRQWGSNPCPINLSHFRNSCPLDHFVEFLRPSLLTVCVFC